MAELRRCLGSAKFGIEAHEAPVDDFPKQASQKDGLGRMCRPHWNQYTTALRKAALARKTAEAAAEGAQTESAAAEPAAADATEEPKPIKAKRGRQHSEPAAEVEQEGAAG